MKIDLRRIGDLDDVDLPIFEAIVAVKSKRGRRPQDTTDAMQASAARARERVTQEVRRGVAVLGLPGISVQEFRVFRPHVEEDKLLQRREERARRKRLRFRKPSRRKEALKFKE